MKSKITSLILAILFPIAFVTPTPAYAVPVTAVPPPITVPSPFPIIPLVAPMAIPAFQEVVALEPVYVAPPTPKPAPVAAVAPSGPVEGCGDNEYAHFIYMHESGCNPSSVNAGGCRGIGQACPGGKLPCGPDYACQNAYFTNYANSAYGGWGGAYNFWLGHLWW